MHACVTAHAESNEILLRVVSKPASQADVAPLQVAWNAAVLAPPSSETKQLPIEVLIPFPRVPRARAKRPRPAHADFRRRAGKVCFSSSGSSSYGRHRARSMAGATGFRAPFRSRSRRSSSPGSSPATCSFPTSGRRFPGPARSLVIGSWTPGNRRTPLPLASATVANASAAA